MFTKEQLKNDKHFISLVSYKLFNNNYKIGRFIDIHTIDQFIDKLLLANLEEVKYLPKSKLHIFRTSDLGFGYSSYLSPLKLQEYINLNKVKKDIPIEFIYQHGNVFTYIDKNDIDMKLLLTDDIYFFINKETNEIWNIIIGKPTNPNFLYFKSELSGFKTTLDKALTVQYFNRLNIIEIPDIDFL